MNDIYFLNDVQYAFLIGRQKQERLCGVSCHIIIGYKSENIDEEKLKKTWCNLSERHAVLCSRIMPDGTVYFSSDHDPKKFFYSVNTDDEQQVESYINGLKNRLMDIEHGEIAALHLIKIKNGGRIIFETDCVAFDVTSMQIFIRDMAAMYCGKESILPELPAYFSPYGEISHPSVPRTVKKSDKAYWTEKVSSFGCTPFECTGDCPVPTVYESHTGIIDRTKCGYIDVFAKRVGCRTEDILLALFARAVSEVTGKAHFMLNIPILDRSTADSSLFDTAADYTSIIMFDTQVDLSRNFSAYAKKVSEDLSEALKHISFSGIKVQQLYSKLRGTDALSGNVTFSSHIHININDEIIKCAFGEQYLIYTETPNVVMDSEFFRSGDHISINLSTPQGYLPEGTEERLISAVIDGIKKLSVADMHWNNIKGELQ